MKKPKIVKGLAFGIVKRGETYVLQWNGVPACRPASQPEVEMWHLLFHRANNLGAVIEPPVSEKLNIQ